MGNWGNRGNKGYREIGVIGLMGYKLYLGKCEDILKEFEANSIEAMVTDPPAGIAFMGKEWDKDKGGRDQWIEYMTLIFEQCLRVLKPGAHALVWALPRTSHWTATALENAGFEIRDVVNHIFGCGFPKSLDIGKAIDKKPNMLMINDFRKKLNKIRKNKGFSIKQVNEKFGFAINGSGVAHHWFIHPTQPTIPTKEQYAKLKKWWNFGNELDNIYFEAEREIIGSDKNWGNKGYVQISAYGEFNITIPNTEKAKQWDGWGTSLKPAFEAWIFCKKPLPISEKILIFLLETVTLIFERNVKCLKSNVFASVAELALKCFLPQFAKVAGNIVQEHVKIPSLVKSELVRLAEKHSMHKNQELKEANQLTVQESAAILLEDKNGQKILTGKVEDFNEAMVTLLSEQNQEDMNWNIVLSWKNILADLFDLMKIFTIETESEVITELKTLNYALSQNIQESIIPVQNNQTNGELSFVPIVDVLLRSTYIKLLSVVKTIVPENVSMSVGCLNEQPEIKQILGNEINLVNLSKDVACEHWILCRKPLGEKTVAENVLKWECGGLNIDKCRVKLNNYDHEEYIPNRLGYKDGINHKVPLNSKAEYNQIHSKNPCQILKPQGRFPANVIHDGSEAVLAGFPQSKVSGSAKNGRPAIRGGYSKPEHIFARMGDKQGKLHNDSGSAARFFYNTNSNKNDDIEWIGDGTFVGLCKNHDEDGLWTRVELDNPVCASCGKPVIEIREQTWPHPKESLNNRDEFRRFFYCAKASKLDRNEGLENIEKNILKSSVSFNEYRWCENCNKMIATSSSDTRPNSCCFCSDKDRKEVTKKANRKLSQNNHPTVKNKKLMRYLCRLITPPGGTVIDPFMGSGSTGKAAILEGFNFIGIEQEQDSFDIAEARIEFVKKKKDNQVKLAI